MEPNQNVTPQTNPVPAPPASPAPPVPTAPVAPSPPSPVSKSATLQYFTGQIATSKHPAILDLKGDNLTLTNTETKELVFSTLVSSLPKMSAVESIHLGTVQVSLKLDGKRYNMIFATVAEADDWRKALDLIKPGSKKSLGALNKILRIAVAICVLIAIAHAIASS